MKEEKTNKKKILTDEELKSVTGGSGSNTNTTQKDCSQIKNQTECEKKYKCLWRGLCEDLNLFRPF